MKKYLLYLLCLLSPFVTTAQMHLAGTIDSSFGVNSITLTPNTGSIDFFLTLSDSIVATGGSGFGDKPVTEKLSKNGVLDSSYGIPGFDVAYIDLQGRTNILLYCTTRQSDGKILVGGSSDDSVGSVTGSDFMVARLNPDGTMDTSFNHKGFASVDFYHGTDYITALAIQPNGEIIASGKADGNFGAIRLNTDGSLDSSFCNCGTGLVFTVVGAATFTLSRAMALQPDGKIVVGNNVRNGSYFEGLLMRYNNNGTLDTSFGNNGITTINFSNNNDEIVAVKLLADGKIIAGGITQGIGDDFLLARYNPSGTLDSTFGTNGFTLTDIARSGDDATCMGIEPDGKIVLAGTSQGGAVSSSVLSLARYNTNGIIDSTFGNHGIAHDQIIDDDDVYALGIQSNGDIVLSGFANAGAHMAGFFIRYYGETSTGIVNLPPVNTEMEVYPNPTHDAVTIFSATYKQWATITVVDVLGKTLQQYVHDFGSTAKSIVNLTSYAPGIYAVHIHSTDGKSQVIKVVRQ